MQTLILTFFCIIITWRCHLKVWKYRFINGHICITLERMKNKFDRYLVQMFSFFSSSRRFSSCLHRKHCIKVDGFHKVTPLWWFQTCCCCYSNIVLRRIQRLLPPRSVDQATCCLKPCKSLARVWFFNLGQVSKSIIRTDELVSQSVSQWASQSVGEGRCISFCSKLKNALNFFL